jgi:hypothetical protein
MTNLIIVFNNLKMQLLEELIDYQKYFNLMKALHFYLKTTIICESTRSFSEMS